MGANVVFHKKVKKSKSEENKNYLWSKTDIKSGLGFFLKLTISEIIQGCRAVGIDQGALITIFIGGWRVSFQNSGKNKIVG